MPQKHTKFDHDKKSKKNTDYNNRKQKIIYFAGSALVLMTSIICIVVLILVTILYKKVDGLEDSIEALQDIRQYDSYMTYGDNANKPVDTHNEVLDIENFVPDESEIVDRAEAAVLDDNVVPLQGVGNNNDGIRRVYLTFDDGPSSNTDRILDILDSYGVKATFFVVAKNNYTQQYKRIAEEGHTLAMHSFTHRYKEIYASLDAYKYDLKQLHDFLYELTGEDCTIVRFPGGSSNTVSKVDMFELIDYLDGEGITYFDWNVSSGDASGMYLSADQIAKNVVDNVNRFDNAVVLFHDAASKDSTVEALPIIIEKILESDNTVILPISEDTVKVQHLHH